MNNESNEIIDTVLHTGRQVAIGYAFGTIPVLAFLLNAFIYGFGTSLILGHSDTAFWISYVMVFFGIGWLSNWGGMSGRR